MDVNTTIYPKKIFNNEGNVYVMSYEDEILEEKEESKEIDEYEEPTEEELEELEESELEEEQRKASGKNKVVDDDIKLYFDEIAKFPICTPLEEREYFQKIKYGDENAKLEFAHKNLRLVASVAKRYIGRGVDFLDLIQEGNLGLLKAIDKFDPSKGYKFSTYSTWWIRQSITRAINDKARTIRLPVHISEMINKYLRLSRRYEQEHGEKPNKKEMAELMNITEEKAEELEKNIIEPVSLNTLVGEDEDTELVEFVKAENKLVEEIAVENDLKDVIRKALGTLTPKECQVVFMRFGLDNGREKTLEEVGKHLGVTRERIRQIEAKALRKLRHPSRGLQCLIR